MNKYVVLVLVTSPLILLAILMAVTSYKTGRSTRRRCAVLVVFWLLVGAGMLFVEPAYNALVRANLTASPPLSVFDVILLAGIVFLLLLIVQLYDRMNTLSRKLARMHEGLAIMEQRMDEVDEELSGAHPQELRGGVERRPHGTEPRPQRAG
jgi:hypothetical protein